MVPTILLHGDNSVRQYIAPLKRFKTEVYDKAFPDENERENFDVIIKRICGRKQISEPETLMVIAIENEMIVGCEIADIYKDCNVLEVIYIVVAPQARGRGIGRGLVDGGTNQMIEYAKEHWGLSIDNVFLESNNPARTSIKDDFNAIIRLHIFEKMGAMQIDIPYVQPPLDRTKCSVDNLLLMSFTQFSQRGNKVGTKELKQFLESFYKGLGHSGDEPALLRMKRIIDAKSYYDAAEGCQYIALQSILDIEESQCRIGDVRITIHYLYDGLDLVDHNGGENCALFHSYQTDLMDYTHQMAPPFTTAVHRKLYNVKLFMPVAYEYTSEGCRHVRINEPVRNVISANISLCYSHRVVSHSGVVHLTLSPAEGTFFTELDIIKLSKNFASKQENVVSVEEILVEYDPQQKPITLNEFVNQIYNCEFRPAGSGITQIELGSMLVDGQMISEKLITNFFDIIFSDRKVMMDDELVHFSSILCGMILGIFDFERMNTEEIFDTIKPIVGRESSFVVMSRGNMLKVSHSANRESHDELIPSPYLLIPSTVFVFNEALVDRCLRRSEMSVSARLSIEESENVIQEITQKLDSEKIGDVFQYPSEKEILFTGVIERHIDLKHDAVLKDIALLKSSLSSMRLEREKRSQMIQTMILTAITTSQLLFIFEDVYSVKSKILLLIVTAVLVTIIYFLNRRTK